ncbi:hypothetical protein TNCV_3086031 [Trichonephila clavipes]|nr:hypothetical protein TNCV_3086031 [Trichonephila clavipes]
MVKRKVAWQLAIGQGTLIPKERRDCYVLFAMGIKDYNAPSHQKLQQWRPRQGICTQCSVHFCVCCRPSADSRSAPTCPWIIGIGQ